MLRHSKRILFTVFLFVILFSLPWWAVLLCAAGGAFFFATYYEMIVLGVLFDILYGTNGGFAAGYGMLGLAATFVLFLIIERTKKELR